MNKKTIIGIDLGGTNMRAGRVVGNQIEQIEQCLVPKTEHPDVVLDHLLEILEKVITPGTVGIGVGVPGLVKSKTGVVCDIENIPSWKQVHLKEVLEQRFKLPVFITNDANCFAIGERIFGAGKAFDDFVGLITGTGLGGGIIKNGKILPDQNSGAGEFGMLPYRNENFEHYCSGRFFTRKYGEKGEILLQKAEQGDVKALAAFSAYGTHLGAAIKSVLFAIDPGAIIVGGSVSLSFEYYREAMWNEVRTFPFSPTLENLKIMPSRMKQVAILGAAALCVSEM